MGKMARAIANENATMPALSARELATVLAGLRYWQAAMANKDHVGDEIPLIANNGGTVEPLSVTEIDDLCERLNTGG